MRSTGVHPVGSTRPALRPCLVSVLTIALATSVATQTPPPAGALPGQSEQSLPTFRASVRYVEVDVDVKVRGQFLAGLTKDDFELFENRQRQVIDRVTFVDIPAVTGPGPQPPAIPAAERVEVIASPESDGFNRTGRIYAMVLGHPPPLPSRGATWAGPPGDEGVKALARKFIQEYLGPDDLLAIVHATTPARGQGLTSDKARLLAAVERYRTSDFPPPPDRYLFSSFYRPPPAREDRFSRLYQTLKEVAVSLGAITGRRKSIILISEGEDLWAQRWDIHDRWAYVRDATRTAAAFNVPIHTIRPRGMVVPLLASGENSGPLSFGFADTGDESGRRLLSEETNGLDLGTVNSADKGFSRVVAQNTRYYILGYYSSLERDGKNHAITVRVKRDGASVNARRGVRTLRPIQMPRAVTLPRALSTPARGALLGQEVTATLPVTTSVGVFHDSDFKAALLVQAAVDGLDLDLSPGGTLEFSVAAVDPQGVVRAFDRRAFTLNVRDDTHPRLARDPLAFFTRLELPPGDYSIRVSAHQSGGAVGVQSREVRIPDVAERALSISDLVLASASQSSLILQPDETIRWALSRAPTLERRFSTAETLAAFAEIYVTHWPLASELTAAWAITKGDTITVRGEQTIDVEREGIGYFQGAIPLAGFDPGDYVLQVEVSSTVGPPATARSTMPFQVARDPESAGNR